MSGNVPFALLLALLAGLSTGLGAAIVCFIRKLQPWHLSMLLGFSAGVMIYVSFAELLHTSLGKVGFVKTNLGFFIGIAFIALVDILIPHEYEEERDIDIHIPFLARSQATRENEAQTISSPGERRRLGRSSLLKRAGILTAIGITIHNFPEGIAVFSSSFTGNATLGVLVATAIAIHNIPEGISVSVPIAEATGSRNRAFVYSFLSGLAEPLGAIISYVVLFPFLTPTLVYGLLAFSAGIMLYISLDELLPTACLYGEQHWVIMGTFAGMLVMAVSIFLIS